jgi:hypothetical protein
LPSTKKSWLASTPRFIRNSPRRFGYSERRGDFDSL